MVRAGGLPGEVDRSDVFGAALTSCRPTAAWAMTAPPTLTPQRAAMSTHPNIAAMSGYRHIDAMLTGRHHPRVAATWGAANGRRQRRERARLPAGTVTGTGQLPVVTALALLVGRDSWGPCNGRTGLRGWFPGIVLALVGRSGLWPLPFSARANCSETHQPRAAPQARAETRELERRWIAAANAGR